MHLDKRGKGNGGACEAHHMLNCRSGMITLEHLPNIPCTLPKWAVTCYLEPGRTCFECSRNKCQLQDNNIHGMAPERET